MPPILDPPLVLVVEDEQTARNLRMELFEASGFAAIGAPTRRDAERELLACPSIDLLVTDVNLDSTRPGDKSGLELARAVKATRPHLPIIGYSGRLAEGDVPREDLDAFNSIHLKGKDPINLMRQNLNEWREIALEYRRSRRDRATLEITRFQERYSIDDYDFNLLREFIPAHSEATTDTSFKSVEAVLSAAGFRLKILEPCDLPEVVAKEGLQLNFPIPIWLRVAEDHVLAEVYRFSELYASGDTEEEAIRFLLLLMAGYHEDLSQESEEVLSPSIIRLKDYLTRLFEISAG